MLLALDFLTVFFETRSAVYHHVGAWHEVHWLKQLRAERTDISQRKTPLSSEILSHALTPFASPFTSLLLFQKEDPAAKEDALKKIAASVMFNQSDLKLRQKPQLLTVRYKKDVDNQWRMPQFCWNPLFLFIPSCLEQITVCPHIRAPLGASSCGSGIVTRRAGLWPWALGAFAKERTVAAFVSHWKGLQVLTAMINHQEADIWMQPGKGSTF